MALLSKEALLSASDLRDEEVYLPTLGGSVRVRALSAAYSNDAMSKATSVENVRGEAIAKFSASKLEELKVLNGMIDPKLDSLDEVHGWSKRVGPAWKQIIDKIDSLSGLSPEVAEDTAQTFRLGGQGATRAAAVNGASSGRDGSDLDVRAGIGAEDAGGRAGEQDEPV